MKRIEDYIKIYDDALDLGICENIIREFNEDLSAQKSTGKNIPEVVTDDGKELWKRFVEIDFAISPHWQKKYGNLIRDKIVYYSQLYFKDINYPMHLMPIKMGYEGVRIKRYLPDSGDRIDEHTDSNNIGLCKRFLSLFWYLNDVDSGGETYFTTLDQYVKPKAGRLLIFPPMWTFPHAGLPVSTDSKYLLHSYLHFSKDTADFNVMSDLYPLKSGAVVHKDINKE